MQTLSVMNHYNSVRIPVQQINNTAQGLPGTASLACYDLARTHLVCKAIQVLQLQQQKK